MLGVLGVTYPAYFSGSQGISRGKKSRYLGILGILGNGILGLKRDVPELL